MRVAVLAAQRSAVVFGCDARHAPHMISGCALEISDREISRLVIPGPGS
jgi:predicted transcriptional regulator